MLIHRKQSLKGIVKRWLATLSSVILFAILSALATSCAHYRVVPSGQAVLMLKENQKMTAPHDGVYVPDALWIKINEALLECKEAKDKAR